MRSCSRRSFSLRGIEKTPPPRPERPVSGVELERAAVEANRVRLAVLLLRDPAENHVEVRIVSGLRGPFLEVPSGGAEIPGRSEDHPTQQKRVRVVGPAPDDALEVSLRILEPAEPQLRARQADRQIRIAGGEGGAASIEVARLGQPPFPLVRLSQEEERVGIRGIQRETALAGVERFLRHPHLLVGLVDGGARLDGSRSDEQELLPRRGLVPVSPHPVMDPRELSEVDVVVRKRLVQPDRRLESLVILLLLQKHTAAAIQLVGLLRDENTRRLGADRCDGRIDDEEPEEEESHRRRRGDAQWRSLHLPGSLPLPPPEDGWIGEPTLLRRTGGEPRPHLPRENGVASSVSRGLQGGRPRATRGRGACWLELEKRRRPKGRLAHPPLNQTLLPCVASGQIDAPRGAHGEVELREEALGTEDADFLDRPDLLFRRAVTVTELEIVGPASKEPPSGEEIAVGGAHRAGLR